MLCGLGKELFGNSSLVYFVPTYLIWALAQQGLLSHSPQTKLCLKKKVSYFNS